MCSINLPNLKKLHLSLCDGHGSWMETLFKSLPLLEDLYLCLDLEENNLFIDISAPNLKLLYLDMEWDLDDCQYDIDAPKLEGFDIEGYLGLYNFVKIPTNLQEVGISLVRDLGNHVDFSFIQGLIQGISCVRSLSLMGCGLPQLTYLCHYDDIALSIFHNLVNLILDFYYEDWEHKLPDCLLGNLKRLELHHLLGNDDEIKYLQHIVSNASVLEEIHVSVSSNRGDQELVNEFDFCTKLFKLSKSSPSCKIKFSGQMINTSSEDFRNVTLTLHVEL